MHRLGIRRLVVVGVPPLGCMPVVRTITNQITTCSTTFNRAAYAFNAKIKLKLAAMEANLGLLTSFVDAYAIVQDAVDNPTAYGTQTILNFCVPFQFLYGLKLEGVCVFGNVGTGLRETAKGCCGTGLVEFGETCKGSTTCSDPQSYVFWDAVHPSQNMYKILAAKAIQSVAQDILS